MKSPVLSSFLLVVKYSLPMKAALEHIAFTTAESRVFESFVCELGTVVVYLSAINDHVNTTPF